MHPVRDPGLDERACLACVVVEGGRPHPPGHRRQRRRLPPGQARTRARAQTLGCQRGGVRRARPRWRAATGKEVRRTPRGGEEDTARQTLGRRSRRRNPLPCVVRRKGSGGGPGGGGQGWLPPRGGPATAEVVALHLDSLTVLGGRR